MSNASDAAKKGFNTAFTDYPRKKYHCLACNRICERESAAELPRSDEHCSHDWELIPKPEDGSAKT